MSDQNIAVARAKQEILILVHGFGDDSTAFSSLTNSELLARFGILCVDLPGFGGQPPRDDIRSVAQYGAYLAEWLSQRLGDLPLGFVGHSVGSAIAATAIKHLGNQAKGLFSIEGNLTQYDLFLTGRVKSFADPLAFKDAFLRILADKSRGDMIFERYRGVVSKAEATSLWNLARDIVQISDIDQPGRDLLSLPCPCLYFWNPANTAPETVNWIDSNMPRNERVLGSSHWPMIDATCKTAAAVSKFFDRIVR